MTVIPHQPYRLLRDGQFGGLKAGDVVYRFDGCTYGCIADSGIAMSVVDGEYPFCEVDLNNLEEATS